MPASPQQKSSISRRPRGYLSVLIVLALALLLSACARGAAQSAAAPTVQMKPTATRIIPPTYTPAPPFESPTAAPVVKATDEATPEASSTQAPTTGSALADVKLVGLSWLEKYKYNLLLSFDFPGPVDPADYRVTLEGKEYRCEVLAQYPNRLYCNGQGAKVLAYARVQIYPAGSDVPGFEQEVWVPYFQ